MRGPLNGGPLKIPMRFGGAGFRNPERDAPGTGPAFGARTSGSRPHRKDMLPSATYIVGIFRGP